MPDPADPFDEDVYSENPYGVPLPAGVAAADALMGIFGFKRVEEPPIERPR